MFHAQLGLDHTRQCWIQCLRLCTVPINFHIGNMGVASYYSQLVDSVPPAIHGGNIDDRRIGKGATMYYPVQVANIISESGLGLTSPCNQSCTQQALVRAPSCTTLCR